MMASGTHRLVGGVLVATVGLLALPSVSAEETRVVVGEVVDPASYVKEGVHGSERSEQTYEAVDGGQTLAILEQGTNTLYLLLAEEPGEDPNELAYDFVNQQVKVTGHIYERGGLRGLVPTMIDPLVPPAESSSAPAAAPKNP